MPTKEHHWGILICGLLFGDWTSKNRVEALSVEERDLNRELPAGLPL
jgi:hypothetical protein